LRYTATAVNYFVRPCAALAPFVQIYVHHEALLTAGALRQQVAARTTPVLEFTFGHPYNIWSDARFCEVAHPVAVVGMKTHQRIELELSSHVETFVIVFQPAGLSHLFALCAEELTDTHFEGSVVLGRGVRELWHRLAESKTFAERVAVVERYLLGRPGATSAPSAIAMAAIRLLRGDSARIPDLAKRAGLGTRQFERRFGTEIGAVPKLFSRVARFEIALQRKQRAPHLRWTDIAQDLGYHDQSHMGRDFLEFAGATASALLSQPNLMAVPPPST
jgi:AraC-like DNA-binding protein